MAAIDNFKDNLRIAIEVSGISQAKLATTAQVSQPYVNRVLQGKTVPSISQCEILANASGFPLSALIGSVREFRKSQLTKTA